MADSLTMAMRSAQSGLLTTQTALGVVADNVANVNTPGYSRKIAQTETRVVGTDTAGVQLAEVVRNIDEGLLKTLRREGAALTEFNVQQDYYDRLQTMFGTPADNISISHYINELGKALESLATTPEQTSEQSDVIRWASEVSYQFQVLSDTVQDLRLQADQEIERTVGDVAILVQQIDDLNKKIIANSTVGRNVADLEDQRDMALDELSNLIGIQYVHRNQGDVAVFTSAGYPLIDNSAQTITHDAVNAITALNSFGQGNFNGIFVGPEVPANDITLLIQSGEIKGLIDLRDHILPDLQSQMDELASELRDAMNLFHNAGVPYPGLETAVGTRDFAAIDTSVTTLTFDHDFAFAILDDNGEQVRAGALQSIMTDYLSAAFSPPSIAGQITATTAGAFDIGETITIVNSADGIDGDAAPDYDGAFVVIDKIGDTLYFDVWNGLSGTSDTPTLNGTGYPLSSYGPGTIAGTGDITALALGAFAGFSVGDTLNITGSTGYDGSYTITGISGDTLTIDDWPGVSGTGDTGPQITGTAVILTAADYGSLTYGDSTAPAPPHTIDDYVAALDWWLSREGMGSFAFVDDHAVLNMDSGFNLAFANALEGANDDPPILSIDFDADGRRDMSARGFSAFFGLNDFYVDGLVPTHLDSETNKPVFCGGPPNRFRCRLPMPAPG